MDLREDMAMGYIHPLHNHWKDTTHQESSSHWLCKYVYSTCSFHVAVRSPSHADLHVLAIFASHSSVHIYVFGYVFDANLLSGHPYHILKF